MGQLSVERMRRMEDISHEYFAWLNVLGDAGITEVQDLQGQYLLKCPFHADKRPSFRIRVHEHSYHCFSCNAYGSVIDLMWKLSNTGISKSAYMEQVLKRMPQMQRELGFNSLFIDSKTLDPGLTMRRRFSAKEHLSASMPMSTFCSKVRKAGDTWENLVFSLTLLQEGESTDNILARMRKTGMTIGQGETPQRKTSLASLISLGDDEYGAGDESHDTGGGPIKEVRLGD